MTDSTDNPEAKLVKLHLDESGLDLALRHPIVPLMAKHLADAFVAAGGVNYVTFDLNPDETGPLQLIMQRRFGKTPASLAARYREALERIRDGEAPAEQIAREALL